MSTDTTGDAVIGHYDERMIREIRSARTQADDDERWSIRLTLCEVDALLRAVDERDDLKRRLIGEWEGDIPEPVRVVEVTTHKGDLGEAMAADHAADEDALGDAFAAFDAARAPKPDPVCIGCLTPIRMLGGVWLHVETHDYDPHVVLPHREMPDESDSRPISPATGERLGAHDGHKLISLDGGMGECSCGRWVPLH